MKTVICEGQPSWQFSSDRVKAAITEWGGHLAPVQFRLGKRTVSPFSVAPWATEKPAPGLPRVLQVLRGDFFCAPFGDNNESRQGELHPPHGEAANARWRFESIRGENHRTELHLSLRTRVRPGRIDKRLFLRSGETVIYCRHTFSGMKGRMNVGHHPTLKFPEKTGSGRISMSRLRFAQVLPTPFEDPARGGYSCLKIGATFKRLDKVPQADGGIADLSRFPARRGFEDLAMVVHQDRPDFAWTAVTFPAERYVWFSLKDPRVLRSTILWISNGGRHYPPWNGRHVNVMGLEDVTSYFGSLTSSLRANPLTRRGIPTSISLEKPPLNVNYIMAVAEIPRGFNLVKKILPGKDGVLLLSTTGHRIFAPLKTSFLYEDEPE